MTSDDALAGALGVPIAETHAVIGSTNDRLRALADDGAPAWTVVLADSQSQGRGRRGARWISEPGCGLWMSVLVPAEPADGTVPLRVGVAVARAVEEMSPGVRVGVKWPNDLLVEGRKLAGILCEAAGSRVIAGIGVNLRVPDQGFDAELVQTATALEVEARNDIESNTLASSVLAQLRVWMPDATGAAVFLRELAVRDVLRGRVVEGPDGLNGRAVRVLPDGGLEVERADGSRVPVYGGQVRVASPQGQATNVRLPGGEVCNS